MARLMLYLKIVIGGMKENRRLPVSFYTREDVLVIARELLGKELISYTGKQLSSGIIIETEAYNGIIDKASHAYGNRRTRRTETMYKQGGIAYIYLCYGIHSLLNVVTNIENVPHAVLLRAIYPRRGREIMSERIGRLISPKEGIGPGKVTKLLGVDCKMDTEDLVRGDRIWIEDIGICVPENIINHTTRIGVSYAQEDALLPYRFRVDPLILFDKNKKTFPLLEKSF